MLRYWIATLFVVNSINIFVSKYCIFITLCHQSIKTQSLAIHESDSSTKVIIKESNSFRGIPYSDYFNVNTEWDVFSEKHTSKPKCKAVVRLDFVFHKSTWLQGTIESNTRSELLDVYELWRKHAEEHLNKRTHFAKPDSPHGSSTSLWQPIDGTKPGADTNTTDSHGSSGVTARVDTDHHHYDLQDVDICPSPEDTIEDDDFQFYDCEEGSGLLGGHNNGSNSDRSDRSHRMKRTHSSSNSLNSLYGGIFGKATTTAELHDLYLKSEQQHAQQSSDSNSSSREVAINFVETVFVLAQFAYWKAHNVYYVDMEKLFEVEPRQVATRIFHSFIPGWHSHLLVQPDIYGPIIAVMSLPQVLKHYAICLSLFLSSSCFMLNIFVAVQFFFSIFVFQIVVSVALSQYLVRVSVSYTVYVYFLVVFHCR